MSVLCWLLIIGRYVSREECDVTCFIENVHKGCLSRSLLSLWCLAEVVNTFENIHYFSSLCQVIDCCWLWLHIFRINCVSDISLVNLYLKHILWNIYLLDIWHISINTGYFGENGENTTTTTTILSLWHVLPNEF